MTRIILMIDVALKATYTIDDPRPPREIMAAVNTQEMVVGQGEFYIGEGERQYASILPPNIVFVYFDTPPVELTRRLYQVLFAIGDGLRAEEIAGQLGISRRTVYEYTAELKRRFGACSRVELIQRALEFGLID